MSSEDRAGVPDGLTGEGLHVGLIHARWNTDIIERLVAGAERGYEALGVDEIVRASVPGSFELPFAAKAMATSGEVDAIVVVGVVIRGETTHYELVSEGCASAIQATQLETGVPIGFGVLTVENRAQALDRSEDAGGHNVGEEAALVAVEMCRLRQEFEAGSDDDSVEAPGGSYL
ncbi:MAG TPA: 6,7-dimethyl-8-ribityllumazine synthase [Acidimicrobiales bacterium]|nr:6,7-dimethyl-8-ribityllumazine synthase [Acidimicrobiales bacterium]